MLPGKWEWGGEDVDIDVLSNLILLRKSDLTGPCGSEKTVSLMGSAPSPLFLLP